MPGFILINPAVFKDGRDAMAVAWDEALRLTMEDIGFEPKFAITPEQVKFFRGTAYSTDETALRKTIVARVATHDTSVSPTPEQEAETVRLLDLVAEMPGISPADRQVVMKMRQSVAAGNARGEVRAPPAAEGEPAEPPQEPQETLPTAGAPNAVPEAAPAAVGAQAPAPEAQAAEGGGEVRLDPTTLVPPAMDVKAPTDLFAEGMVERGNINLFDRPHVQNPDGSVSTVRSMSFQADRGGPEILVPTVSEDGRIMSNQEATKQYQTTGRHLGKFKTPELATKYAQALHEQQAELSAGARPAAPRTREQVIEHVISALSSVESNERPHAIGDNGLAVGLLQLHPDAVKEANRLLGKRKWGLADRYDPEASKAMARVLLTSQYNRGVTDPVELGGRWNRPSGAYGLDHQQLAKWAEYKGKVKEALRYKAPK